MAMNTGASYHDESSDDFTTSSSDSSDFSSSDDDVPSKPRGKLILNLDGGEIPKQLMMRCRVRLERLHAIDALSLRLADEESVDDCSSSDSDLDVFSLMNNVRESRARPLCKRKHKTSQAFTSGVALTKIKSARAVEQAKADSRASSVMQMLQSCRNCKVRLVDCWQGKPLPSYLITKPAEREEATHSSWKKHKKKKKSSKRQVESEDEKPSRTKHKRKKARSERRRVLVAQESSDEECHVPINQSSVKELTKHQPCKVEQQMEQKEIFKVKGEVKECKSSSVLTAITPWSEAVLTAGLPKIPKIKKSVGGSYVPASQEQVNSFPSDPYQRLQKREARRREFEKMAAVKYGVSASESATNQTVVNNVVSQPAVQSKQHVTPNSLASVANQPSPPILASSYVGMKTPANNIPSPLNSQIPRPPIPGQLHNMRPMGNSCETQPSSGYKTATDDHRALLPNPQMPSPVIPQPKTPLLSNSRFQEADSASQSGSYFRQKGLLPDPDSLLPMPTALLPTPESLLADLNSERNVNLPELAHNKPSVWKGSRQEKNYSELGSSAAWQSSKAEPKKHEVNHQKMPADSTVDEDTPVNQNVLDEICRLSLEISKRLTQKPEEGNEEGPAIIPLEPDGLSPTPKEIPLEKTDVVCYDYGHTRPPLPQTTTTLRAPTPPPSLLAPPMPPILRSPRVQPAMNESTGYYSSDNYQPKDYYAQSPTTDAVEDLPSNMSIASRCFENNVQREESYEDILAAEQERTRKELYYQELRRDALHSDSNHGQSRNRQDGLHSSEMGGYTSRGSYCAGYNTDSQYERRHDDLYYSNSNSHQPLSADSYQYNSLNQSRQDLYNDSYFSQERSLGRYEDRNSDRYQLGSGYTQTRQPHRPSGAYDASAQITRDRYGLPVISSDEETSAKAPPPALSDNLQLVAAGKSLQSSVSTKVLYNREEDNESTGLSTQANNHVQHNSTLIVANLPPANKSTASVHRSVCSAESTESKIAVVTANNMAVLSTCTTPAIVCNVTSACITSTAAAPATPPPASEPPVPPATEPPVPPASEPPMPPATEPPVPPASEPPMPPATEPPVPPASEPPVPPASEPPMPPASEPPMPPAIEPAVPPAIEPAVPPAIEPAVPPAIEPAVPPAIEPAVPPLTKPLVAPATDLLVPPTAEFATPPVTPSSGPPVMQPAVKALVDIDINKLTEIITSARRLQSNATQTSQQTPGLSSATLSQGSASLLSVKGEDLSATPTTNAKSAVPETSLNVHNITDSGGSVASVMKSTSHLQSADSASTQYSPHTSSVKSVACKSAKHSINDSDTNIGDKKIFNQSSFSELLEKYTKKLKCLQSGSGIKETDYPGSKLPSSEMRNMAENPESVHKVLGVDAQHITEDMSNKQSDTSAQGVSCSTPPITMDTGQHPSPANTAHLSVGSEDMGFGPADVSNGPCTSDNLTNTTYVGHQLTDNALSQSADQLVVPTDPHTAVDIDDNETASFFLNVRAGLSDYQQDADGKQVIPGLTVIEDSMTADQLEELLGKPRHSFPLSVPELITELTDQLRVILSNKDSDSVLKAWIQVCLLRDTNKLTFNIVASRRPQLTDLSSIYNKALINILSHKDTFRLVTAAGVQRWLPGVEIQPMVRQSLIDVHKELSEGSSH